MADSVEEKIQQMTREVENKQQFIENWAHEMKTPLTAIFFIHEGMQGLHQGRKVHRSQNEAVVLEQGDKMTREVENKQQFIEDWAHEMKTPLTAILGYTAFLRDAKCSEQERLIATGHLYDAARRLLHKVDQQGKQEGFVCVNGFDP